MKARGPRVRGGHVSSHSSRQVIAAAKPPITTHTARTAPSSQMVLHGKLNSTLPYFMATPPNSTGSAPRLRLGDPARSQNGMLYPERSIRQGVDDHHLSVSCNPYTETLVPAVSENTTSS